MFRQVRVRMFNRPLNAVLTRLAVAAAILATLLLIAPAASAATATYTVDENTTETIARFTASDEEGQDITWGLEGADAKDDDDKDIFEISKAGVLTFASPPNYEKPSKDDDTDNVYEVTVTASGKSKATQKVEVTVIDVDEDGKVTLDHPQPQVGTALGASYSDEDSGKADVKWQWSSGDTKDGDFTDIDKATTDSYTVKSGDAGKYLKATVTYTDKFGSGKTASEVSENAAEARPLANAAPKFTDEDKTTADVIDVKRSVNENAKGAAVGKPATATDADDDILLYTLSTNQTLADPTKFAGRPHRLHRLQDRQEVGPDHDVEGARRGCQ